LFLGPEGAGKTALLEMLQTRLPSKKLKNPPPSLQPRAFDLAASGPCGALTAIDQPGADKLRAWWATALLEADGVVFACDSRHACGSSAAATCCDACADAPAHSCVLHFAATRRS
jgi:hypothetical protein